MAGERALRLFEFGLWVVAASGIIVFASLGLGLLLGGDLLTGKHVLFVVGFLVFGVGSLLIQPSSPRREGGVAEKAQRTNPLIPRIGPEDDGASGDGWVPDTADIREQLGVPDTHPHRFEAKLGEIGPLADHDLPHGQRIGRSVKIFATGVLVLLFSFAMEVAGVQV